METSEIITGSVTLIDQMSKREGHFYYAKKGAKGDERRKKLAEYLYKLGLR